MKHAATAVVLTIFFVASLYAQEQPDTNTPAPAPVPAENTGPKPPQPADNGFRVSLAGADIHTSILFRNGKAYMWSQELQVHADIWFPEGSLVLYHDDISIEEATVDTGDDIIPAANPHNLRTDYETSADRPGALRVGIYLDTHLKPFKSIALLKGSIPFTYAASSKKATVTDPAQWAGKRINIPELTGCDIVLVALNDKQVVVSCGQNVVRLVKSVTFLDGHNNELKAQDLYWTYDTRAYSVELPQDGSIVFEIAGDVKTVSVPFEFKNIPLEAEPEPLPFD